MRGHFTPDEIDTQLGISESQVWDILKNEPVLDKKEKFSPGNQASWMEMNLYMQNQLLRDSDVMSMAHGLEIRVPFLDAEFIRLSLQICSAEKYKHAGNKQLLIDSFKDILPEAIWNRPKMGFSFPFKEWLARDEYARSIMGNDINKNYKKFKAGEMHWSQYLTSMLIANHQHA